MSFSQLLNSYRVKSSRSRSLSSPRSASASTDSTCPPRSQSDFTVTSARAVGSHGSALRRFSPTAPPISPARSTIASSEPYWPIHLQAVFGPTFSTPGTLSTASPTSVR